ncbi:group II truncated hemoglobin [Jiangella asiatica]|uniref:Antibiotic biosynthesis monooxygenase n=1 Tax=Jiangella asiatica TaxID=2530372 RepID=A0A4R5DGD5_9ACTN|nr:antibiotic biosynthesis monooxygenase [Jiangella asiatica]TDE10971.1 antibiotic biosynthesis monooxygenase [Jiangella asiatica]
MIVEYIRYRIEAAAAEEFEAAYRRAGAVLREVRECVDFELTRCVEAPEQYVVRIRWTSAEAHLSGFRNGPAFARFFEQVRPYVDAIEEMRHYETTGVGGGGGCVPTLYEWAGGAPELERLFTTFYGKVVDDPQLGALFDGMDPEHPRHVAAWLGEVFGGPAAYSQERGGHAHMVGRHLGKGITEPQRRRWVSLLLDTADEVGLPADPEFRAAFAGYLEWGSRMAVVLSQPGVRPGPAEPMPAWSWPLPPWQPDPSR